MLKYFLFLRFRLFSRNWCFFDKCGLAWQLNRQFCIFILELILSFSSPILKRNFCFWIFTFWIVVKGIHKSITVWAKIIAIEFTYKKTLTNLCRIFRSDFKFCDHFLTLIFFGFWITTEQFTKLFSHLNLLRKFFEIDLFKIKEGG